MVKKVFFVLLYLATAILTFNNQMMPAMYLMATGMLLESSIGLINFFLSSHPQKNIKIKN